MMKVEWKQKKVSERKVKNRDGRESFKKEGKEGKGGQLYVIDSGDESYQWNTTESRAVGATLDEV